jgi:hypothetical protein
VPLILLARNGAIEPRTPPFELSLEQALIERLSQS